MYKRQSYWLDDWALFCSIKSHFNNIPWTEWPIELRDRHPKVLDEWRGKTEYKSIILEQTKFQSGWEEIHDFANKKNVSLIGDVPIFVAHDSADVWAHRHLFQLEKDGNPSLVSGVPPDYFSEDGQKWGTVLYDWEAHEKENYNWWRERINRMLSLFDIIRIDHFRGFHSAWAVPRTAEDGVIGEWQDGPKDALIQQLVSIAGDESRIIAEDLGIIPQEVVDLRLRFNLRGMAILQFGFGEDYQQSPHHPDNITDMQVVYTGTHDNDTLLGWWQSAEAAITTNVRSIIGDSVDIVGSLIEVAKNCSAPLCIIPLQEI